MFDFDLYTRTQHREQRTHSKFVLNCINEQRFIIFVEENTFESSMHFKIKMKYSYFDVNEYFYYVLVRMLFLNFSNLFSNIFKILRLFSANVSDPHFNIKTSSHFDQANYSAYKNRYNLNDNN